MEKQESFENPRASAVGASAKSSASSTAASDGSADAAVSKVGQQVTEQSCNTKDRSVPAQRKALQRQNLEDTRAYIMKYDQVQKKLVVNEEAEGFVHNIWSTRFGKDPVPGRPVDSNNQQS
mmetsp:Transcript_17171/g.32364  ORF Transcript_17171/g.32364 Transcript_17171/m.32364 type:complete len:121 (+) Transcript_17171:53-415(+)